jgi:hypothetical protein
MGGDQRKAALKGMTMTVNRRILGQLRSSDSGIQTNFRFSPVLASARLVKMGS